MRIVLFCGLFFFVSCSQQPEKNVELKEKIDSVLTSKTNEPLIKIEKIDFNFLTDCDSLEIWLGDIQGVGVSESAGPYVMAQCFANKQYDIIVFSKEKIELKEAINNNKIVKEGLAGAEYFAFEIAKKRAENPENEFDIFDYVYPNDVKVYKLFSDGWYLVDIKSVTSDQELNRLKLNSIHRRIN